MSARPRYRQMTTGRCTPRLEWLEHRSLLSVYPAGITAVSPADGTALSQSPQQLVISFDPSDIDAYAQYLSSIFPFQIPASEVLSTLLSDADVQLLSVNRDGSTTPVFNFALDMLDEQTDSTGTELIIPMQLENSDTGQLVNATLSPGVYQVELEANTSLAAAISESYSTASQPLWNDSIPLTLSTFTVLGTGATFDDAMTLPVGPTVQTYTSSLNPDQYQSALDLYKFTLAPGQLWQLGVSISTQSIDSPLLTTLSLFDANGNLLAESNAGDGFPSAPNDPYLFAGLSPTPQSNTYFIGVSGYGNTPYGSQGYDPILGIPGSGGMSQPGGPFPFELSVVAQPHDQVTQLVSFSLNHVDPLDPSPTSITLTFSGPIDVSSLFVPDRQETSLEVVDSSGATWPVTAETYQANLAQLTLIFDEPLPPGEYSLMVPSTGGLTDLAGQPVAGIGEPAGILASWTVAAATATKSPDDLGIVWPSKAGVVWPSTDGSLSGSTELAPGQDASYRWVVIVPGYYKVQTQVAGGQLAVENSGNGTTTILDAHSSGNLNNYLMYLNSGVYELRLVNVGPEPTQVNWILKIESLDWEKIVNNGVSPTSALSLMTFAPALAGPDVGSSTGFLSIGLSPTEGLAGGSMGPIPASLFISSNTALAGQPAEPGQPVATADGLVDGAIAVGGISVGQSRSTNSCSLLAGPVGPDGGAAGLIERPRDGDIPDGTLINATSKTVEASIDPDAHSVRADARALAQAEWLDRLDALAQGWFGSARLEAGTDPAPAESLSPRLIVGPPPIPSSSGAVVSWRNRSISSMSKGEFCTAASVLTAGVVAYRLRKQLSRWWRMRGQLAASAQAPRAKVLMGPHPKPRNSRVTTRVRKIPG